MKQTSCWGLKFFHSRELLKSLLPKWNVNHSEVSKTFFYMTDKMFIFEVVFTVIGWLKEEHLERSIYILCWMHESQLFFSTSTKRAFWKITLQMSYCSSCIHHVDEGKRQGAWNHTDTRSPAPSLQTKILYSPFNMWIKRQWKHPQSKQPWAGEYLLDWI